MPNSFVDNEGFSVGTSYVGSSGFMGVSFTRYDALYGGDVRCDADGTCAVDPTLELQQIVFQQRDAQFYGVEAGAQLDIGRV